MTLPEEKDRIAVPALPIRRAPPRNSCPTMARGAIRRTLTSARMPLIVFPEI